MTLPLASPARRDSWGGKARLAAPAAAFAVTTAMLLHRVDVTQTAMRHVDSGAVLLAAAASLPLIWWRRSPLAVFVITAVASAPLLRYQPVPPLGPTMALYLLAASHDARHPWTRRSILAVAVLFAVHLGALGLTHDRLLLAPAVFCTLGWAVAWFAGDRAWLRRERLAALEERAATAERAAERERQLAAVEERMRIARDLHDSAGHAINVILVQAGAARLLQQRDAAGTRTAIDAIEEVARRTLWEIDALVGILREGPAEGPNGLAALATLVAAHRANGLDVALDEAHDPASPSAVPATVDQAAYRIVQEALTNAARHGSGPARVRITHAAGAIEVTVSNPCSGEDPARGGGHGLVGMRERAVLVGGWLEVSQPAGHFEVRAHLPLVLAAS
jgi:signal transduction histidine kinase